MALTSARELEFEEASPLRLQAARRIGVAVLGVTLAALACGIIGVAFVQGSWWYTYGTDRALERESRVCVERIRDAVDVGGEAPEAVMWLNAALDPSADPTAVRTYLLAAQEVLAAADDPELAQAASELQGVMQAIRPVPVSSKTAIPRPVPTLEWP
jgi:hypothetical protein